MKTETKRALEAMLDADPRRVVVFSALPGGSVAVKVYLDLGNFKPGKFLGGSWGSPDNIDELVDEAIAHTHRTVARDG